MAVEDWIDAVTAAAGTVAAPSGGQVLSYRVYARKEIPEDLTKFPCALTFVTRVRSQYSDAGPCVDLWDGKTEFHIFPNTAKSNLPEVMLYFSRIRNAFAKVRTLGGKVDHFMLKADEGLTLDEGVWGGEVTHYIITAHWTVKEGVTDEVTLGM